MEKTKYTTRYVSRIVLEAETPLAVGTGEKSLLTDALVVTDINGLPFIPGTSLAGVIRSACGIKKDDHTPFGYQDGTEAEGSKVIFSDGVMIGSDGSPVDGLRVIDGNDPFYSHFKTLPVRQHVRINSKGSTDKGGKFDEQVAYKGMRFCFEMELLSTGTDDERDFYLKMLGTLCSSTFRIGSGTRNGFGSMKVVSLYRRDYELTNTSDLESYVSRSAALDKPLEGAVETGTEQDIDSKWHRYVLNLQPEDFFLFGSGLADDEADFTPVKEPFIEWENDIPRFSEHGILIPASSVKGAIAHRTAYHWNKLEGRFADQDETNPLTGDDNPAVVAIFGKSGQGKDEEIKRGNIMLSDVFIPAASNRRADEKILNHVAIDRFTGGAMDGALFTEKVINGRGRNIDIELNIDVLSESISNEHVRKAFEASLQDIADGLLPLGGSVNRGNGMFKGTLTGKIE